MGPILEAAQEDMEHDFREIVDRLGRDGDLRGTGLRAEPVGRNRVWRVVSPNGASGEFYVKFARERAWYERELQGLEVAGALADRHDWAMAPTLLFADPEELAVVTSGIPGASGNDLIRRAYRIDRNPLRFRDAMAGFREFVRRVVEWLRALHAHEFEWKEGFVGYQVASVRDRTVRKLERALEATSLSLDPRQVERLASLDVPTASGTASLICGDASLGNFLWDRGRIGRIDFEDLGVGPPGRDFNTIRLYTRRVTGLPWYWSDDELDEILPDGVGGLEGTLHTLEWKLDYHWEARSRRSLWPGDVLDDEVSTLVDSLVS